MMNVDLRTWGKRLAPGKMPASLGQASDEKTPPLAVGFSCRAESASANEFERLSPEVRGRERGGNEYAQTSGTRGLVLGPGLLLLPFCVRILYRGFVAIYNINYVCP